MKMLLGLIKPTSGAAFLWGKDVGRYKKELLPKIGCIIESPGFYPNLTGKENLEIFATLRNIKDKQLINNSLELVGLPIQNKKLFSQYSMGMKQRLSIALAIMHNPELLILDEPTNGLDPAGVVEIRNFIKQLCKEEGKTILISSHIMNEIELLADDIGIINKGKLMVEGCKGDIYRNRKRYIEIMVSSPDTMKEIIDKYYRASSYEIIDKCKYRIYDLTISVPELNKILVRNGIEVEGILMNEESLENYFIRVTGGDSA